MENAIDALKMAFGIMMFVLALTLSISCFSRAREAIESIVYIKDRENFETNIEAKSDTTADNNRVVGVETVVPTIYKAIKENVELRFYESDGTTPLNIYIYTPPNKNNGTPEKQEYNTIDTINLHVRNTDKALTVVNELLKKGYYSLKDDESIEGNLERWDIADINSSNLYDFFKDKLFEEKLGEFNIEDEAAPEAEEDPAGDPVDDPADDINDFELDNVNKTKKRVIKYILIE